MAKNNGKTFFGFWMNNETFAALTERAKILDSDRSKLARQAINAWLRKNSKVKA
jgi:hypothetical protein